MWKESKCDPVKIVDVNGFIMFATGISPEPFRYSFTRFLRRVLKRRETAWYEYKENEEIQDEDRPEPLTFIVLGPLAREIAQLRLFNIFTQQEYTISFQRIFDEVRFLASDNPIIVPHDVVENTMCAQFLLFFQVHTRTEVLFIIWDLERNQSKWKELATGVLVEDMYKIKRLLFGNALMGYLAKSTGESDKYVYILRDLATGVMVQTFQLDGYRDPLSSTEFDCAFTSFAFIVSEPEKSVEDYLQSVPNAHISAPFHVYSISSGQKIYTLQCPMLSPGHLNSPIVPWFGRTDESERYWIFLSPELFENGDSATKVYVWDVRSQQWTFLASRCIQKDASTIIYTEDGRMKIALLDLIPDEFKEDDWVLSKFKWRRLPTVKEATEFKLKFPRLNSLRQTN
jgi:hypothetical protein